MHGFTDGGDDYQWLKSDWMSKQDEETQTKVETRGREGCVDYMHAVHMLCT